MNLLEAEQGFMLTQPPIEVPGAMLQFKSVVSVIERNPTPVTMFIPDSPTQAILAGQEQAGTDTAIVGEDRAAVRALILDGNFIRTANVFFEPVPSEDSPEAHEVPEAPEKNGLGKNMLLAARRSRLGIFAATAATTAVALFSANTETAKGATEPVLTGNVPSLGSDAAFLGAAKATLSEVPETTTSDTGVQYDPEALKQRCKAVALAKPEIVKSQMLHAGKLEQSGKLIESRQDFYFTAKYQPWPEECRGLYSRGGISWAQAFHNGKLVRATPGHGLGIIADTNVGSWYDLGNGAGIDFPICRARIQLKANMVDLSVSMNEDIPWKPHHPTIASRRFAPIPVDILPHKPKEC